MSFIPNLQKSLQNRYVRIGLISLILLILWSFLKTDPENKEVLQVPVTQGDFEISVQTTGEIRAKNQTDIEGPGFELQQAGLWNGVKIQELIPEGTLVKAGDFVASLEKTALMGKLSDVQLEFEKKESELRQARLDTAITLRDARDELLNLKSAVQEAKLEMQQSVYEAPAIQQQKVLALEKSERSLKQKTENYETKVAQSATKVAIIQADLSKAKNKLDQMNELIGKMDVKAPKDGMVLYVKNWNGTKKAAGSNMSPWEPAVATLPDLREIQVVTFVNEVDIRKIKAGQEADISLDAEPDKKLKGVVVQVANIGEQRPNQDAKVFEVVIDILNPDSSLRPSMTTSNIIRIGNYKNVLSVPLEALNSEKGLNYVWKKRSGSLSKQEVLVAATNDQAALIYGGIEPKDEVLLGMPNDTSGMALEKLSTKPKAPQPVVDAAKEKMLKEHLEKSKKSALPRNEDEGGAMIVIEGE